MLAVVLLFVALLASGFDTYLATPYPPADGFDLPTSGGAVRAAAHGKVMGAAMTESGGAITIEHVYYENHEKQRIESSYQGLSRIDVKPDQLVQRGQIIGSSQGAIRFSPERSFVAERRRLFVPQNELSLVLVDQASRRLALYERGKLQAEVEVGFGQRPGRKRRQGDLKTPRGMYFVISKSRGPFTGQYGEYYGGHWIKLNYPNGWDADWGVEQKLIEPSVARAIKSDWAAKRSTDQRTPLGGGIGFHGWASEWSWEDTGWLSWGCIVFHNPDIERLFDRIPAGAMVVLL